MKTVILYNDHILMKRRDIIVSYSEYDKIEDLSSDDRELIEAAREASANAYAPYSGFSVGAAIRLSDGTIVKGANVENAAYPSGICAERNALANSVTNHPGKKPLAIAIAAFGNKGEQDDHISPCGMCRQVIAEEEIRIGSKIRILLSWNPKIIAIDSIGDLLPLQFNKDNLRIVHP